MAAATSFFHPAGSNPLHSCRSLWAGGLLPLDPFSRRRIYVYPVGTRCDKKGFPYTLFRQTGVLGAVPLTRNTLWAQIRNGFVYTKGLLANLLLFAYEGFCHPRQAGLGRRGYHVKYQVSRLNPFGALATLAAWTPGTLSRGSSSPPARHRRGWQALTRSGGRKRAQGA